MAIIDLPLEELRVYEPDRTAASDFDAFWSETLAEQAEVPLDVRVERVDYPAVGADVYRVMYDGWHGARICGWYLVPHGEGPFPGLIQYHGYSGSKGDVHAYLMWALQGYAVFAVDVRDQSGDSTDPGPYSSGHVTGWMTKGISDKEEYYYRGVYVDCVRALDVMAERPEVDASHIGLMGGSQGGGLTLAAAALDTRPAVALPEIPYLCHFRRALDVVATMPYQEIAHYIKLHPDREEQVWHTLTYFDNLNLAGRVRCPVLMDVGLQDDICPPSTIFAVYNHLACPKELKIYPFHKHESVEAHWEHKLRWAHRHLKGIG